MIEHLIITIDGPAGAGKSSASKKLASRLGLNYLDTGALYRAIAFFLTEMAFCQRILSSYRNLCLPYL